jgi:protein SCO1/2
MRRWNLAVGAMVALATTILVGTLAFAAPAAAPCRRDSVYQLSVPLTDQQARTADWRTRRGKPQCDGDVLHLVPVRVSADRGSGKAVEHQLTPAQQQRLGILLISMDPARRQRGAEAVAVKRKLDPPAGRSPRRAPTTCAPSPACSASATARCRTASSTTPPR